MDLSNDNYAFGNQLNELYVDKSAIIAFLNQNIESHNSSICVSSPRRFGKTYIADMLQAYYSDACNSKDLFEDLKISKAKTFKVHINQYHTIIASGIDYVYNPADYLKEFEASIKRRIAKFFNSELKICEFEEVSLPAYLDLVASKTSDKFVIIIDEYDYFFRQYGSEKELCQKYLEILRSISESEFAKHNLSLLYLTGIFPISFYDVDNTLGKFKDVSVLNSPNSLNYIGFT